MGSLVGAAIVDSTNGVLQYGTLEVGDFARLILSGRVNSSSSELDSSPTDIDMSSRFSLRFLA